METKFETNEEFFKALEKLTARTELLEVGVERAPNLEERHPLMHFDVWFIILALCSGLLVSHSQIDRDMVENLWFIQTGFIIAALVTNLARPRALTVVHNFNLSRLKPRPKTLVERQQEHGIKPASNVYRGHFPLEPQK